MGGLAQNVQKPPPGKNVQKSQGQEFQECVECQECQGQMPRSNFPRSNISGMPRSNGKIKMCRNHHQEKMCKNPKVKYFRNVRNVRNAKVKFPKVKYFRNAKVKWENKNVQKPPPGKNVQKSQGQEFQECVECQECENGKFSKIIFHNFLRIL